MNELNSSTDQRLQAPSALLIDAPDACKLLCLGERRLWSLSNCRAIPSYKIGKSRRYCPNQLRAWVKAGCPTQAGAGDRIRKELLQ
jgi:hypothetical protein